MKRYLSSKNTILVLLAVVGFIFALLFVCSVSYIFNSAVSRSIGIDLPHGVGEISSFGFLAAIAALCLLILSEKHEKTLFGVIARIDYPILLISALGSAFIGNRIIMNMHIPDVMFIFIALAIYMLCLLFLVATVIGFRDRKFVKCIYLIDFFKTFNLKTPLGISVMFLLITNSLIAVYSIYKSAVMLIASFLIYVLVVYLCKLLISLSEVYKKASEESLKSERLKIELITSVSHDIRTPLTSIINYVDLIKRLDIKNERLSEYTDILAKKAERLKVLVSDLMDASKAGTGNVKTQICEVDLSELIRQIAGEYDNRFEEKELDFIQSGIKDESVFVLADSEILWRVAENIFSNAVKYSMRNTRIYCDVNINSDTAVLSLKNISEEPLNIPPGELTERFVRGDTSRGSEGNGLGLYIAKSLAELTGASFSIMINGDLFEVIIELPISTSKCSVSTPAINPNFFG